MNPTQSTPTDDNAGLGWSFDTVREEVAKICVVGVGGGGGNAINNMVRKELQNVEFMVINTDAQALSHTLAPLRIQSGRMLTKGLGTGARPEVGREAMWESAEEVKTMLHGFDMCFITAGMGGGTGTGGAAVVAEIARQMDILVVAIVTKPFDCEGDKRMAMALDGIQCLEEHVDTIIAIPNERLLDIAEDDTTLIEAFQRADDVLYDATRGIADLITCAGLINLDFADVRTTIQNGGTALMGTGTAGAGDKRAEQAALEAISSPLMDGASIAGARNVLVNITAGKNLGIKDATSATQVMKDEAGSDAEVIWGTVIDETLDDDEFRVTVIATGFGQSGAGQAEKRMLSTVSPRIDYKGEENLKVLDIPAFERRGPAEQGTAWQGEGAQGKAQLRRVGGAGRDESRRRTRGSDDESPSFLRKMMD